MSVRLYVGNLPKETVERPALQAVFAELGDAVTVKVIKDRKTNKCRGFAFVTVPTDELADELIEKYNGQSFMESPLKIEKALPRTKGKGKDETGEETPNEEMTPTGDSSSTNISTESSPEEAAIVSEPKPAPIINKPQPAAAASTSTDSTENPERKRSTKKQPRTPRGGQKSPAGSKTYTSSNNEAESIQPDPRWASELAKLKDMLSTQTANT